MCRGCAVPKTNLNVKELLLIVCTAKCKVTFDCKYSKYIRHILLLEACLGVFPQCRYVNCFYAHDNVNI